MAKRNGKAYVGRHGKKNTDADVDDRLRALTKEGWLEMKEKGEKIFGGENIIHGAMVTSDYLRTQQTGHAMFIGGEVTSYSVDGRNSLGLSPSHVINGEEVDVDFYDAEHLPNYKELTLKNYNIAMFENHFFPSLEQPHLPSMGNIAVSLLEGMRDGLASLKGRGEGKVALAEITHAPNIENIPALALDYLDFEGNEVRVNGNYEGPVKQGQGFEGHIEGMGTHNPSIVLDVYGKEWGMKLSDLGSKINELNQRVDDHLYD